MRAVPSDRYWQVPAIERRDRLVGGVSAGIASELGLDVFWVRLAFVALFTAGGWGALLYAVVWGWLAIDQYVHQRPEVARIPKARNGRERLVGFALATLGGYALFERLFGLPNWLVWPLGLLALGIIVLWQRRRPNASAKPIARPIQVAQTVGGLVLIGTAVLLLVRPFSDWAQASAGLAIGVGIGGALLALSAPWWWRLLADLDAERQARVRSEERAEVAAHIHDSVLQTLSLIQRHSDDPQKMVGLARRQERELRNWLDPDRVHREGGSVRGQLDDLISDLEDLHGITIDAVVVGDCLIDARVGSMLSAVREAAVNSAKHAGVERIDIYVEVQPDAIEAFVRDAGTGFELSAIPDDRQGVRHSIQQRMQRIGGSAIIVTAPGEGTEVELRLPRRSDTSSAGSSDAHPMRSQP
ncbi:MAG: PspC domain-containing protein [Acidimicrobiales bacterium]